MKTPRPSSIVARQIAEFEALLPKDFAPPTGDFASELQWRSWQNHLSELKKELEQAIDTEMETSDVQISLAGSPVKGHSVAASFLAGILGAVEKLVSALGDFGQKAINSVFDEEEKPGLVVDGVFQSSFGLKMRIAPEAEEKLDTAKSASLAEQFCGLLDGATENSKLQTLLSDEKVRSSYLKLMKQIASADGKIFVRTRRTRYGVSTTSRQARERIDWFSANTKSQNSITVTGVLVGGSIPFKKFEIMTDEERYAGSVSSKGLKLMPGIKFGDRVQARLTAVKKSRLIAAGAEASESHVKYCLEHIFVLTESEEVA